MAIEEAIIHQEIQQCGIPLLMVGVLIGAANVTTLATFVTIEQADGLGIIINCIQKTAPLSKQSRFLLASLMKSYFECNKAVSRAISTILVKDSCLSAAVVASFVNTKSEMVIIAKAFFDSLAAVA